MENQKPSYAQSYQRCQNQQSYNTPFVSFKSYLRFIVILMQNPNTLSDHIQIVDCIDTKQAKKELIVKSSNAVIEKSTMMIELFTASVTSIAMIAVHLYVTVANNAEGEFLEFACQLFICDQTVHRIESCKVNVVVDYYDEQSIMKAKQHPQNLSFNVVKSWNYEH